jgi:hypothetical protein
VRADRRGLRCLGEKGRGLMICDAGSDYPVLQDYESYKDTFSYIERLGFPKSATDKILHHNAQRLFGFRH